MKIWTQWPDLETPQGFTHLASDLLLPDEAIRAQIEFYVPRYMSGSSSLEVIKDMKSLKIIQSPNAGYDDVLKFLPDGVILCNAAGVHDVSTAELAIGLSIAIRRGFNDFFMNQSRGVWVHERKSSLADSKVGIVGHGNIGRLISSHLQNFETEVISFSRSGSDGSLKMDEFDRLLPELDIVILILPLTSDTRHFMNSDRLSRMKAGSSLVNVARGAVVDTDALMHQLNSGRITAALDVTDPEPLPDGHPLWCSPNLIISPHVGGDSAAFEPRIKRLIRNQLGLLAGGEQLMNIVAGPKKVT